jgi:hypothetical protein
MMVIEGAAALLKAFGPVLFVELHEEGLKKFGTSVAAILDRLSRVARRLPGLLADAEGAASESQPGGNPCQGRACRVCRRSVSQGGLTGWAPSLISPSAPSSDGSRGLPQRGLHERERQKRPMKSRAGACAGLWPAPARGGIAFPCWADDARTPARSAAAHQPVPNPGPKPA